VSWLENDLVESSTVGSQIVQLGSYSEIGDRRREAVSIEVEGSTALAAITRQRLVKTQQTENT
jgi:hypothetical protein